MLCGTRFDSTGSLLAVLCGWIQAAYRGMAERKRLGITARPLYSYRGQRWAHPPTSMGASGSTGTGRAGFAGLADVAAELRELQRLATHL